MNSSPASSYARASSSSTRSARSAVISPMRYVSILTPVASICASTADSGSSTVLYRAVRFRSSRRSSSGPMRRRGVSARRTSPVGRRKDALRGVAVDVEVAAHRGELLRDARLVRVLEDVLAARRRQLVRVLDHAVDRAVLRDQLPGRLVADAGDAGDVVARVPL